jgi:uncharacterized protein YjgD (DUF1641 family)
VANPIAFYPAEYDPKQGLMKRLEAAPKEHAEALLVAYDLLQEAHEQGILDGLHGLVHAKDQIFGHIAEGASVQGTVDALRNLISAAKMLAAIEPETMSCIATAVAPVRDANSKAPSLWQLVKSTTSQEGRRGIGIIVNVLLALGKQTSTSAKD